MKIFARFESFMFILLLVLEAACSGVEKPDANGTVIFIALDGADWDIIDPLIEKGKLPNFEKMVQGGTRADLESLDKEWVFYPEEKKWGTSPAIWTSAATGKLPSEHGINDFIVMDEGVMFPITSNYLTARPVWDVFGEAGLKVAVIGWWASWPAKPVNGFMVSDHVGISRWDLTTNYRKAGFHLHGDTYPLSLLDEIAPYRRAPSQISTEEALKLCNIGRMTEGLNEGKKLFELKIAIASDLTYAGVGLYLMDSYHPDFVTPYIEGVDIVQHLFWKYMAPDTSLYDVRKEDVDNLGGVIASYHVLVDSILGEYLKRTGERDCVIIASDHGFMSSNVRSRIHISGEHDRTGVLLMYGSGIRKGFRMEKVNILDVTPMLLYLENQPQAHDMSGEVPLDAFTEDFKRERSIRYVDTYEKEGAYQVIKRHIPSQVDSALLEKLEALGYLSRE